MRITPYRIVANGGSVPPLNSSTGVSIMDGSDRIPAAAAEIRRRAKSGSVEWPTLSLIIAVHIGLGAITWHFHALPVWVSIPVAAFLAALHSSVQHEALHGHPTRNAVVNEALVFLPFLLTVPYRRYKATHLQHHNDERLTDPYDDPESFYLSRHIWESTPRPLKTLFRINNTLLGRLTIGPALVTALFWMSEARMAVRKPGVFLAAWLPHMTGIAIVLVWVSGICAIPFWLYAPGIAYPGMSLILLRSFAEHQARENPDHRTVVVESSPLFGLLYLNNNLHFAHHEYPQAPWYRLPGIYRTESAEILKRNGGYRFAGYGEILRRYFFRSKEPVAHPEI